MKIYTLLVILVCVSSCRELKKDATEQNPDAETERQFLTPEFQSILDSAEVTGSIVLYDLREDTFYSNDFERANQGKLPASTFKIANSIIGLETGVIESDTIIFKWDGQERGNSKWEQDLILRDAFRFSCVPCYQKVAREIGSERMNEYVNKLDYGAMQVDSSNIDMFWLEGNSRITPMQQIDFLKRLYLSELPISDRTEQILSRTMLIEETEGYRLSGKTGLSNTDHGYNGWFVGFIECNVDTYFFATNIEPKNDFDYERFVESRLKVTFDALKYAHLFP